MTSSTATIALRALGRAILETLAETGPAPEGVLYAAMVGRLSLDQWRELREGLVAADLVHAIEGPRLGITEAGRAWLARGGGR